MLEHEQFSSATQRLRAVREAMPGDPSAEPRSEESTGHVKHHWSHPLGLLSFSNPSTQKAFGLLDLLALTSLGQG